METVGRGAPPVNTEPYGTLPWPRGYDLRRPIHDLMTAIPEGTRVLSGTAALQLGLEHLT
jgi:hypothetical protein